MAHANNLINILYWNANSIREKLHELYDYMSDNHIHITCLCETFLKSKDKLHSHPDFITHRFDRDDRPKGGVAIIIRRNIAHNLLPHPQTKLIECIGVEVQLANGSKINIWSAYMPGGSKNSSIRNHFASDINKLTRNRSSYFICGDLNARHRHWNCSRANPAGTILYDEYCRNDFLIAHPATPTRIPSNSRCLPSTIDLTLTNGVHQTTDFNCITMSSDHLAVSFSIKTTDAYDRVPEHLTHHYKKADWERYRGIIHYHVSPSTLNLENVTSADEIDRHIDNFHKLIEHARDKSVPLVYSNKYKLDIPEALKFQIKLKNNIRRTWQRTRNPILKQTINRMEKEIKSAINELRNDNWQALLSDIKPSNQSVWRTARMLKCGNKIMPPLKDTSNNIFTAPQEKADLIALQFYENHQNPLAHNDSDFEDEVQAEVLHATINQASPNNFDDYPDEEELTGLIKRLKNSKSPGIDGIRNILLKKLPERGRAFLLFIICACMKLSYFPSKWKHAKVIAIPKPGKDHTLPTGYRPISLLNAVSKLLERVILTRINKFLDEHDIIPPEQHGFRAKFSTTRQLHNVISNARQALSERSSMGIVMLDVEKAFDRVWHDGLLFKMIKLNFPQHLIRMTNSFLKNRSFHVDVRGKKSEIHPIPFGVPQGAVLSPTLYNIYIHDVPKTQNTKLALFADDTAFFSTSQKASEIENALKEHSRVIEIFSNKWKIKMNSSKTQATFVTRRRKKELPAAKISLLGADVNWRSESKYLGMILDKSTALKPHIDYVIERTNNAIRILYPLINRNSKLDLNNKLLIYKLAIRPIFTYASPAMRGIAKTHIKKFQVLQNKTLKMILNVSRYERTSVIHERTKVPLINDYLNKLYEKFQRTQMN
jgi:hypothetical protein